VLRRYLAASDPILREHAEWAAARLGVEGAPDPDATSAASGPVVGDEAATGTT
jgi:hypothetical protein